MLSLLVLPGGVPCLSVSTYLLGQLPQAFLLSTSDARESPGAFKRSRVKICGQEAVQGGHRPTPVMGGFVQVPHCQSAQAVSWAGFPPQAVSRKKQMPRAPSSRLLSVAKVGNH